MKAEIKRILATYIEADVGATITGFEKASEEIAKSYEDYAEKGNAKYTTSHIDDYIKETSVNYLIYMLKKYEGYDIIERWQMNDDFDEWINQKYKYEDK